MWSCAQQWNRPQGSSFNSAYSWNQHKCKWHKNKWSKYEKKHFSSFSFLNNHSLFYIFFQFCLLICTFNPFSEIIKIISVEYLRFTTELNTSTTYNTDKIFMVWIKTLFVWFQSCLMSFCSCLRYYNWQV